MVCYIMPTLSISDASLKRAVPLRVYLVPTLVNPLHEAHGPGRNHHADQTLIYSLAYDICQSDGKPVNLIHGAHHCGADISVMRRLRSGTLPTK